MTKIEIELTDEQIEKLSSLTKEEIDFGKAIDDYFEARQQVSEKIEELERHPSLSAKLVDNVMDVDNKAENLDENYGEVEETFEVKINDVKHSISWAKDFFKI
ncbi:hypothetical protein [Methanobrevibacter sp.]|uniref:hypothetical protein n=1 Tax=Methanobrevibacter sp. TaxID=66852 RepID=UPI00388DA316